MAKNLTSKVNIVEKTLLKRVNRHLAEDGKMLCKNKKTRSAKKRHQTLREQELGTFYLVSGERVVEKHVDLEKFARKHEILKPHEALANIDA